MVPVAISVAVTCAFATMLPEGSVIVPLIDPVSSCATAGNPVSSTANRAIPASQWRTFTEPGRRMNCWISYVIADLQEAPIFDTSDITGLSLEDFGFIGNRFLAIRFWEPIKFFFIPMASLHVQFRKQKLTYADLYRRIP